MGQSLGGFWYVERTLLSIVVKYTGNNVHLKLVRFQKYLLFPLNRNIQFLHNMKQIYISAIGICVRSAVCSYMQPHSASSESPFACGNTNILFSQITFNINNTHMVCFCLVFYSVLILDKNIGKILEKCSM